MSKKYTRWRSINLPKVENIQLSTKNILFRSIAIGVLIVIAAVCLGSALTDLLNTEPGWESVTSEADELHCGNDFNFSYDFTDYGGSATAAYKQLTQLYSQATQDAYRIFETEVAQLSAHVNETVTVDEVLYDALALIETYENRNLFLAPVYVEYNHIFICDNAVDAARYDPAQNSELMPYISRLASFANDPEMISMELLEGNQVRLNVAQEYLDFAEEYGVEVFVDFGWMRNAFVVDYLADVMTANGFTSGYLVSYDGFTRNLDTRGNVYGFNIFDRQGTTLHIPAVLQYSQPTSIVFLRDYPMDDSDRWHYFDFGDGNIASVYIDPADGVSKAYYENLVSYARNLGCAEILLRVIPSFITDTHDTAVYDAISDGVHSIFIENQTILYTEENASLEPTEKGIEAGYSLADHNVTNP